VEPHQNVRVISVPGYSLSYGRALKRSGSYKAPARNGNEPLVLPKS